MEKGQAIVTSKIDTVRNQQTNKHCKPTNKQINKQMKPNIIPTNLFHVNPSVTLLLMKMHTY